MRNYRGAANTPTVTNKGSACDTTFVTAFFYVWESTDP